MTCKNVMLITSLIKNLNLNLKTSGYSNELQDRTV